MFIVEHKLFYKYIGTDKKGEHKEKLNDLKEKS